MTDPRNIRKVDDERQKRGRTYKKRYRINKVGKSKSTNTVAIPPEVIERKAEEAGLTPEQYIDRHEAVAHFNSFDGVFYEFVERAPKKGELSE